LQLSKQPVDQFAYQDIGINVDATSFADASTLHDRQWSTRRPDVLDWLPVKYPVPYFYPVRHTEYGWWQIGWIRENGIPRQL